MAGSSPSLPDGSNPSAAIVQSASDVQCSRLLKTTVRTGTDYSGYGSKPAPTENVVYRLKDGAYTSLSE